MRGFFYYLARGFHVFLGVGNSCRFVPTCSQYADQAVRERGVFVGVVLAFRRILRCHPWGSYGIDPVPERPSVRPRVRPTVKMETNA